jgi:hypothetical protein
MSPPPAGSGGRTPLGRLVDALRRRLRPERGAPPATVPGLGSGEETAVAAAAKDDAPEAPGDHLVAEPERAVTADEPLPVTDGAAEADPTPAPEDADARFDAARDRLRSTIEPPSDDTD